jgi:hypothetical protein
MSRHHAAHFFETANLLNEQGSLMNRSPRAKLTSMVALTVAWICTACAGELVAPSQKPTPAHVDASLLSDLSCGGIALPTNLGTTNTGIAAIYNLSCSYVSISQKYLGAGGFLTGEIYSLPPRIYFTYYAPLGQVQLCASPRWDTSRTTCFDGPPNTGASYAIPIYVYQPPPEPMCPVRISTGPGVWGFTEVEKPCKKRLPVRTISGVGGVRG